MWPSVEPEKILHGKAQLVVDVRSPAEFAHAHIPGAISLPLFSNEERAVVGKIYKENGHDAAVSKGLDSRTKSGRSGGHHSQIGRR